MPHANVLRVTAWLAAALLAVAAGAEESRRAPAQHAPAVRELDRPQPWDWRSARLPRIRVPPDPALVTWTWQSDGWAMLQGGPGCVSLDRPGLLHVVNLQTGDQTTTRVRSDGSFSARVFAPPGSALQLMASQQDPRDTPPELHEFLFSDQGAYLNQLPPHLAFAVGGLAISIDAGANPTTSPGSILRIPTTEGMAFVHKVEVDRWVYGSARLSHERVWPGARLAADLELHVVSLKSLADLVRPPRVEFAGKLLFDAAGRQHPCGGRLSASHVLTPTGLPIETMGELVTEPRPGGHLVGTPGGSFAPLGHHRASTESWNRVDDRHWSVRQRYILEVPANLPAGRYGVVIHVRGIGPLEFDAGPQSGMFRCAGLLRVGDPAPPRITPMLLASTGAGGARGTLAREDRDHVALNFRHRTAPDKLIIARDDAFTGQPLTYALDPYVPLLGLMDRPAPVVPPSPIPLDFRRSRLSVSVTAPSGITTVLGPAPLTHSQCDNAVLRPDLVLPGRVVLPIAPTFGNPSLAEIHHLTSRGAFDFTFDQYGHHQITLQGSMADDYGTEYDLSGTYDVYVAREMDIEMFPEFGTPLYPDRLYHPQVRVMPPCAAHVDVRIRYYPYSQAQQMQEFALTGRANRWGIFLADGDDAVTFTAPGEFVCDVTATHCDEDGTLWMASYRGASIVAEVEPELVAHGERGNRSPTGLWRARWFRAGVPNFVAPPPADKPAEPFPADPEATAIAGIDLGHTCYPYESGDVAWLGDSLAFSLFPNVTFEDPVGRVADLLERRWPGVRSGEGRAGLYPQRAQPEDRRAIGELPYVTMTSSGLPPSVDPAHIDLWGYFYTTSWRPGVSVRSQVSEDMLPAGYWFFDDAYGFQFGNAPHGDLAGDYKMNYAGGVWRDVASGTAHYSAYASMLVLIDRTDPRGPRVLPPFDGLVPGSPPCGPLLVVGGRRYDAFLTFGPAGPGALLEPGQPLAVSGVMWPPVAGHVAVTVTSPSGARFSQQLPADAMGVFHQQVATASEPGVWLVRAEGTATGKTSVGILSQCVPAGELPRAEGLGLHDGSYPIVVTAPDAEPIRFDIPAHARTRPPSPLVIRGHLPTRVDEGVQYLVSFPGQVLDSGDLPVHGGAFEYVYDPERLAKKHPNLDTRILTPHPHWELQPAWFDTVTLTFWAGQGAHTVAGVVALQGEEVFARDVSGSPLPDRPHGEVVRRRPRHDQVVPLADPARWTGRAGPHSSLLTLSADATSLFAAHPWSQELVRMRVDGPRPLIQATTFLGGRPRSIALSPDGTRLYVSLSDTREIAGYSARTLQPVTRFDVSGEPRGLLVSRDGTALYVADFDHDRVVKVGVDSGATLSSSGHVDQPHALAMSEDGSEVYAVSFRSGEILVLDGDARTRRQMDAAAQSNQAVTVTLGGDGLLYVPQVRSDTTVGGQMFDRTVFPTVSVADPQRGAVTAAFAPDLLVTPPHRPVEAAVDGRRLYVAFAGSDDVMAIDRRTGLAVWHTTQVGLEPGALALDPHGQRLFLMAVTGQEIVTLAADTGHVLDRMCFTWDPTSPQIARGRYLFQTATDARLTKDRWVSCAVCHPDGRADGRQWNLGHGPLDTSPLAGIARTAPLHPTAHLDEIQDTYDFTRLMMAGQWFVPRRAMHDYLGASNAGLDEDLDALAAYVNSLEPVNPPQPSTDEEPLVRRGREVFFSTGAGCARCHPPPDYTDSGRRDADGDYVRHDVGTTSEAIASPLDTPSLLGLWRSAPYLHHGRARTLEDVFTAHNPGDRHGKTSHLDDDDIRALATFLRYLRRD
ncbi:MAG: hypothetical protein MUF48_13610 [Pirellulaceae bacterium]|jgi:DNA-binding beta-propeller fold protein YncE|nr:hypothetical protein [Pirellulaceae bacterium]